MHPHFKNIVTVSFNDIIADCEDVLDVYLNIKDATLKLSLLGHIKNYVTDWAEIYLRLFPYALTRNMIEVLLAAGETAKLQGMIISIIENYREHREAFIWIVKNLWDEPWFAALNLSYDKILITLIHILDITFKEIENHRDTTENRRLNKQVDTILFGEGRLEKYLEDAGPDTTERIFALIGDVKDLDPSIKVRLRRDIAERYPELKFNDENEKTVVSRGLIVTASKFEEKQRLLAHIMTVDVPANQSEISYALSLGDLRENSEYKAAKEKQDELNSKVAKLTNEIERAQIFDPSTVTTSKISFATEVLLKNEIEKSEERYIIMGPWESDPGNHIISYLSPLGKRLMNHKVGDKLSFVINDREFVYSVKQIKLANL